MKALFITRRITIAGEPMGVMQLSAIARQRGWESYLADSARALAAVDRLRPDLVAVSCMSGDYSHMRGMMRGIRARHPQAAMLLGGPHPTFVPEVSGEVAADGVCVGEGEDAFNEALERLEQGVRNFSGIRNIQTADGKTEMRPLITDLDRLPFIDRELIYRDSPWKHFKLRSFYTSRGCPYRCAYCFNHAYRRLYDGLGPAYRKRSVEHVLEEIGQVKAKYPTEFIRFSDDVFVIRHDQWLEEFSHQYRKRIGVPFYCLIKSDIVTPEVVALLKQAGCASVCMSIETANEKLRGQVLDRRGQTNREMIGAFELFNRAGINVYTNSMVALPHSTIQDELDTIDLYLRAKPKCGLFTICVPYPGTELFRYCASTGLIRADLTHDQINQTSGDLSMLESFSEKEKSIQKNISLLGTVAVAFPRLKKLITRRLIYLPNNRLFFLIYFLVKNYQFSRYIVPIRYSLLDYLRLGLAALKNDAVMFITQKRSDKAAASAGRTGERYVD